MDFLISPALAQGGAAPAGGGLVSLLPLVLMVVAFYFLLIRPQQKRAKEHREMVEAISPGAEVVTSGGLLGKVTKVGDQFLTVEVADGMEVRVQKHAIGAVMPKGTVKDA
ncbi:MAG: preprotein translocase subunit YajC [Pseudomonadota bacterium]